ncbi:hypothetical protein G3M48_002729 [Beauveria asiatica]|uniref:Uncharacterized protein n=1 Tax=Beauveria asiatica TaxID=1069075 RepID=A0AAW0RXP0_9HYPO
MRTRHSRRSTFRGGPWSLVPFWPPRRFALDIRPGGIRLVDADSPGLRLQTAPCAAIDRQSGLLRALPGSAQPALGGRERRLRAARRIGGCRHGARLYEVGGRDGRGGQRHQRRVVVCGCGGGLRMPQGQRGAKG